MKFSRISRDSLPVDTKELARALIGHLLVRRLPEGIAAGRIIETEAYVLDDPASHAFIGERARNASMFKKPFHAYVYLIYGTNFCFNVSAEPEGRGAGVLIRALEPLDGLPLMQKRRGTLVIRELCRGPGRLCSALDIDRSLDGVDLVTGSQIWLAEPDRPSAAIGCSRRIGISRAAARALRFYERGNPLVSGPKALSR